MQEKITINNRLIAKNAIFLYMRMIVMMAISLFTSREVLRVLGVDDFGIYGIIGGVIVLFSFFQSALTSSSQRFFSHEIGKGDKGNLSKAFGSSILLHLILVGCIIILSETIGLWFVNNYLNIPDDRWNAAKLVYQYTILTFIVNVIRTPYNSAIIANERMSFYAYISIVEAGLKLCVVYLLNKIAYDRLVLYSILLLVVSIVVILVYIIYVTAHFKQCRFHIVYDKGYLLSLTSFSGWSLLGGVTNVLAQQGSNILLNIYKGVAINAAFGIANQVSQAVYSLSSNLQNAFSPQIVKLHSAGNLNDMYRLVYRSTLISFNMMLLLALPLSFKMDFILKLWLHDVPTYASSFSILMVLYLMVDTMLGPLITVIHATGRIKVYYIWMSAMISLCLPLAWIALHNGMNPNYVLAIRVLIDICTYLFTLFYLNRLIGFSIRKYVNDILIRCMVVSSLSTILLFCCNLLFSDTLVDNLMYLCVSIVIILIIAVAFGFDAKDRNYLIHLIITKIK